MAAYSLGRTDVKPLLPRRAAGSALPRPCAKRKARRHAGRHQREFTGYFPGILGEFRCNRRWPIIDVWEPLRHYRGWSGPPVEI